MSLWDELLLMTMQLYGKVLDAGCGDGTYSHRLATEIPSIKEVVSADMVLDPHFYTNCPESSLVCIDMLDMACFDANEFDCCVAWHVLEHCPEPLEILRELRRVTRDIIFLAMPVGSVWGKDDSPGGHCIAWDVNDLIRETAKVGLVPICEIFMDSTNSMNCLFRKG